MKARSGIPPSRSRSVRSAQRDGSRETPSSSRSFAANGTQSSTLRFKTSCARCTAKVTRARFLCRPQLAMAILLQAYAGVSDAEAVDRTACEARWQMVLGTLGEGDEPPFAQGTRSAFRGRLIKHDMDRRLLKRTVALPRASKGSTPRRSRSRCDWPRILAWMSSMRSVRVRVSMCVSPSTLPARCRQDG